MTSPPGAEPRPPSFTKCDDDTLDRIMSALGESGPRAVVFWVVLLRLANRARLTNVQPTLEGLNWPYLACISGINERTLRRLRPALEREGIATFSTTRHEVRVKILAGYWPNGAVSRDAPESQPDELAETPDQLGVMECPARLKPAYDAFMATGKMPSLTPAIIQRVDGSHPKARFLERFEEVAERLAAVDRNIGDPYAWLLTRAREMSEAARKEYVPETPMGGEHMY